MDERNYRSNRQDEEKETNQNENRNPAGNDDSSYYYSYGPFQSVNQEDTVSTNGARQEGNVEITRPDPVKPVPSYSHDSSGQTGRNSVGGGSSQGGGQGTGTNNGNWNYNSRRPRSSVRSLLFSFIAGMLVITVLMYTADRTNMFTPQAALTNNGTESAQGTPSNTGGGNNVTASLLPTGKEDVSSVVKQASPAVVKIETLARQSTRGSG